MDDRLRHGAGSQLKMRKAAAASSLTAVPSGATASGAAPRVFVAKARITGSTGIRTRMVAPGNLRKIGAPASSSFETPAHAGSSR
jgi:hypothetical protein